MEGPSDEDGQASDYIQQDDQHDSPPPSSEVMRFHPSDGDLLNILLAKISGHSIPTQIYIKVVDLNPHAPGFFEPDKIRGYCRREGSEEEQQEWYLLIPADFLRAPLLSCLNGLWKMQEGSWKKYCKQGEVVCGGRFTFEFFLKDSSRTSWRLYEYIIYMPQNLPPLSNQMWVLYRMSDGEVSETSSSGSGWSQQAGSGTD